MCRKRRLDRHVLETVQSQKACKRRKPWFKRRSFSFVSHRRWPEPGTTHVHSRYDRYEVALEAWAYYLKSFGREQCSHGRSAECPGTAELSGSSGLASTKAAELGISDSSPKLRSWCPGESSGCQKVNIENSDAPETGGWNLQQEHLPFSHAMDGDFVDARSVTPPLLVWKSYSLLI
ncbi:hypothetical protein PIB30_031076 [Stylosanthes scabra]|uniref:Uncharacterized protein n=1 Tax=Stylosanthes scabra TaxID=79078 RepID=A0ABU6SCL0_9FABA|nr:hypothetical protein [Stylosanthes scabra]